MTVYVVSSFRDYGDGERYFSADGVFANKEDALDFIRRDSEETRSTYEDLYDAEIPESVVRLEFDEEYDCRIDFDGHTFLWRIDSIITNELFPVAVG